MDLLLQLQLDVTAKLNSEPVFQYNSVASYRQMVISQEIELKLPHLTAKNGLKGCGAIVHMPTVRAFLPNVTPPQGDIGLAIDVIEHPEINFNAGGTQIACEQMARSIRACLHQFAIEGKLLLLQDATVIAPLPNVAQAYPKCCGYRVNLRGRMSELPVPKCVQPAITQDADSPPNLTLQTTDAGAAIWFTTDGSFPGPANAAPAGTAQLYTGPFAATQGMVVRWAAYLAGYFGSDACQATITY